MIKPNYLYSCKKQWKTASSTEITKATLIYMKFNSATGTATVHTLTGPRKYFREVSESITISTSVTLKISRDLSSTTFQIRIKHIYYHPFQTVALNFHCKVLDVGFSS